MLKLEMRQLLELLETSGYIFEQCAYTGVSGEVLRKELADVGLSAELSDAFVAVWEQQGALLRAKLSERSIVPKTLESSDWSMSLRLGQEDRNRIKVPTAVVSLTTRDQDHNNKMETRQYEFSHAELVEFSKHLDRIQEQLDSLG